MPTHPSRPPASSDAVTTGPSHSGAPTRSRVPACPEPLAEGDAEGSLDLAPPPAAFHEGSLDVAPPPPAFHEAMCGLLQDPRGQAEVAGASANQVQLRGRISHIDEPRVLPSGDTVVQLRLVVPRDRPTPRRGAAERTSAGVDTIDVACWTPTTQRAVARIGVDGQAEVFGVLRRRFFRAGGGPASRYEVEARRVRRVVPPRARDTNAPAHARVSPAQAVATQRSGPAFTTARGGGAA